MWRTPLILLPRRVARFFLCGHLSRVGRVVASTFLHLTRIDFWQPSISRTIRGLATLGLFLGLAPSLPCRIFLGFALHLQLGHILKLIFGLFLGRILGLLFLGLLRILVNLIVDLAVETWTALFRSKLSLVGTFQLEIWDWSMGSRTLGLAKRLSMRRLRSKSTVLASAVLTRSSGHYCCSLPWATTMTGARSLVA